MFKKIKQIKEYLAKTTVYLIGSIGVFILGTILFHVISTGSGLVSIDMITGDSRTFNTDVSLSVPSGHYEENNLNDDWFYTIKWGIAIMDDVDREGNPVVKIVYLHPDSPFKNSLDRNNFDEHGNPIIVVIKPGVTIEKVFFDNDRISLARHGAEAMYNNFENAEMIKEMTIQFRGGGIRGSLITTLWMIGLTLALAVPIGVSTAVYFNEFAKKNKFTLILRSMIDLLTGVPSIIYGMMGAAVFIPLLNRTINTSGGSVLSGAFTLAVILLPVIIKSTEEALKIINDDLRQGSLALGANQTQTLFKVVLPNALPGILTGVLLGIGRIIGESAALIFAVGAVIKDNIILTERSTTLAVHIWTIMGGEKPNFELASAISIIILCVVFIINFIVKMITNRLRKNWQ